MISQLPNIIVRYAMVILFCWFALQQLLNPSIWVIYLPEWTGYFPIPGEMLVRLNGWFELIFAVMLAMGFCTRFVAAILGLHLLGIGWTAGGAIGMRDAILGLCALSITVAKPDDWTFDKREVGVKREVI